MSTTVNLSQLKLAYEFFPDPIGLFDNKGCCVYVNPAFCVSFEIKVNDDALVPLGDMFSLYQSAEMEWDDVLARAQKEPWKGQVGVVREGQSVSINQIQISAIAQQDEALYFLAKIDPEAGTKQSAEALAQLAYKDCLTGLANRSLFNQLFDHEISQSQRLKLRFAVLFIDLDKFKQINDTLGHDAGDALLCTVAERLQKSLRKSDVVARLGGDEFAVIMNNIRDSDTVAKVTEKLIREIKKPIKSGANIMEVGCSVGISVYPENGENPEQLLQHADAAMYRAKHHGGSHYYYFSDALNQELQDIRLIEQQLYIGIEQNQFVPYFQPVVDSRNNTLAGIECLARWQHPSRGLLSAMEFIPVAMKIGLLQDVFKQVLLSAFSHLAHWRSQCQLAVPMAINISSKQFFQQDTFDHIETLMKENQLLAEALRLEVTESTLQESGKNLVDKLQEINTAGFSITLDDFGTGYSSLRYLQQLPVDTLKIDRSFVRNLDNNPHDKVIVKAIIQLAETLGIQAVAEGVENQAQAEFLSDNNCHLMQGYLYSAPLDAEAFSEYLGQIASEVA